MSTKKPATKKTAVKAKDLKPKKAAKGGLLLPAVQKVRESAARMPWSVAATSGSRVIAWFR